MANAVLNFIPVAGVEPITLVIEGDTIAINGDVGDFGFIEEGGVMSGKDIDCYHLDGDVTRVEGALHFWVILPCGSNAPHETRFPKPLHITRDGPVELPLFNAPETAI
jgi:hypothetical protein